MDAATNNLRWRSRLNNTTKQDDDNLMDPNDDSDVDTTTNDRDKPKRLGGILPSNTSTYDTAYTSLSSWAWDTASPIKQQQHHPQSSAAAVRSSTTSAYYFKDGTTPTTTLAFL